MAATGLLGFNPYGKAQALDFSSKPTQLAIQLQQKEQAKAEAYEKYFMDYEKSLNPAGLAEGESREFLNKYNRIKENWIKNKQSILNPARYGYEAQAEYSALLKDAVSYIDLGKQATAERKAYSTTLSQARKAGKNIEGDMEVTANAMKTVGLGYEAPDISRVDIFDPYDDRKFMQNVWGTAELPTKVINKDIGGGKVIPETYHLRIPEMVTLAPERLQDAEIGTRGYVRNNRGAGKYFKTLMADEQLLAEANKVYKEYKGQGAKINDEEDFAVAYGLIKKPGGFVKAGKEEETKAYTRAQQDALIRGRQKASGSGSDVAKFLEGGVTALNTNNASFINDYFKPWKAQTKTGTGGDVIGFQNIELLPDGTVKVNYSTPMTKSKKGTSFVFANPQSRIFNPKSSSLLQELTSLHQELLGSSVKAEDVAYTDTNPTPPPSTDGKVVKPKGSAGIDWGKQK
jgi:hypothetical protein